MSDQSSNHPTSAPSKRTLVVHPHRKRGPAMIREPQARLTEALGLCAALGLDVVGSQVIAVASPRAATWLGSGKVDDVKAWVADEDVDLVVIDGVLSPIQQRNLENAWDCKVIDRTGLILEIFGARARTREGVLQVELAQLTYQRSRLVRAWTHLERQRGGVGTVGGPGERQMESDRRGIDDRIIRLRKQLEEVARTRELHRKTRRQAPYPVVALTGYTNSGKSTLFNYVTNADVEVRDQLFATLDPTMRKVDLPSGRRIILSDTVGFIADLPTDLVAAFRATLEEVLESEIIVHVRDIAHPDSEAQRADVLAVLADLGIGEAAREDMVEVFNKVDLLDHDRRTALNNQVGRQPHHCAISALKGTGMDEFLTLLDRLLSARRSEVELRLQAADGAALSWLYRRGEVLDRQDEEDGAMVVRVRLDGIDLGRFEKQFSITPLMPDALSEAVFEGTV